MSVLSGIEIEKTNQTKLHYLGMRYNNDVDSLNTIIDNVNINNSSLSLKLKSLPIGYPITKDTIIITSDFGIRNTPFDTIRSLHYGVDIKTEYNDPIIASGDGVVFYTGYDVGYGNFVMIQHSLNLQSLYAHLNKYIVKSRTKIHKGDTIGYSGSTGRSTGVHLHYEIISNNNKVDPVDFIFFE